MARHAGKVVASAAVDAFAFQRMLSLVGIPRYSG